MYLQLPTELPIPGDDNPGKLTVVTSIGLINNLITTGHIDAIGARLLVPASQWEYLVEVNDEAID